MGTLKESFFRSLLSGDEEGSIESWFEITWNVFPAWINQGKTNAHVKQSSIIEKRRSGFTEINTHLIQFP